MFPKLLFLEGVFQVPDPPSYLERPEESLLVSPLFSEAQRAKVAWRVLWWERAFSHHRGMDSAQKVLEPRPLSPSGYPGNRRCWMLTLEGLVAFTSAETLTALGTQLPAPGSAEGSRRGGQAVWLLRESLFGVVLSPGILGAWAQDCWHLGINPLLSGLPEGCSSSWHHLGTCSPAKTLSLPPSLAGQMSSFSIYSGRHSGWLYRARGLPRLMPYGHGGRG